VAGCLAGGVPAARFGKPIDDYLRRDDFIAPVRTGKRMWTGTVLHIDHFGNLVTNIRPEHIPALTERPFEARLGPHRIGTVTGNYAEAEAGEPFLIVGSSGYLEVSMREAPAAKLLGCAVGAPVDVVVL
jgi:S-adenosylmethionine hydrolase